MKLRPLELKDAPGMLEWIKDPDINRFFKFDPEKLNIAQAEDYITSSWVDDKNRHFAIADDNDDYLGTISLKNIDWENLNAEYAISLRKKAIGSGAGSAATKELLRIAFDELGLEKIYLNVYEDNTRAIRFYEKIGFTYEGCFKRHVKVRGVFRNLCWYAFFKEEE